MNPVRKLSFYFGLAFVFVVFGMLPELLTYVLGMNTYVIYLVAPGALLGALETGGVLRTLKYGAARYWVAFFVWMVISVPFSFWQGGSTSDVYLYLRVCMTMLVVVGGIATNWGDVRAVFYTIGMAGVVNLLTARIFAREDNGRISMDASGSIGNPNDLAAHLLLVLPFLLYISMDRKRNPFLRFAMFPLIGYGLWLILGTASRGGLIAVSVVLLFLLVRATAKQRLVAGIAAIVVAAGSFAILPRATLNRLGSLFGEEHEEAKESAEAREYLFQTSLRYTLEHPVFGVGVGQFANFEGSSSVAQGKHGSWHATHCSWTQVSSECGIPAFIFFVLGVGSALVLVNRIWRQSRAQGFTDISNACFCYMTGMLGFLVAITFLANAYRFYFPAMVGLAIAMSMAAQREMSARTAGRRQTGMFQPQSFAIR